ncbi:MAG: MFS transporter [Deltaproteobacteria bacterium]|nr:MFS transporter [Deltaproteobacteria bacterium]
MSSSAGASETFTASKAYTRWVLTLLFGVAILNMLDRQILGILVVPIKAEFGVSDTAMGFLTGPSFALFYAVAGIPVARYADRGVRRTIIATGLALWSGLTLASSAVSSFAQLVVARLGVGIGEAAGTPPSHALISDYFPPDRRASALALFSVGGSMGVALALLMGGWVEQLWGWRAVFAVAGAPGIVLALLMRFTVKEPPRGRFDGPRAASSPGSSSAGHGPAHTAERWPAALGQLLRIPAYRHVVMGAGLHSFAFTGSLIWYPAFLTRVHGFESGAIGTLLAFGSSLPTALGIVLGGLATDRLQRRDPRWITRVAAITMVAYAPFALGFLYFSDWTLAVANLVPAALAMGASVPGMHVATQALAPPHLRALASAVTLLVLSVVGSGLGPFAVGVMNDLLAERLGDEAVRYTLSIVGLTSVWSGVHYWLAERTLARDLVERAAADAATADEDAD